MPVLKCYDWAIAMRDAGKCVMLGAHSQLEKDVLHYLLKGTQPIIVVLARGMKKKLEQEFMAEVANGRLLIVAPFDATVKRVTTRTAELRNMFLVQKADAVVAGHARPGNTIEIDTRILRRSHASLIAQVDCVCTSSSAIGSCTQVVFCSLYW